MYLKGDEEEEGAPPPVLTDVRRREIMGRLLELLKVGMGDRSDGLGYG